MASRGKTSPDGLSVGMTVRIYSPLPSDHPFYAFVGRVASEWSHLEHILDQTIWVLASWQTTGFSHQMAACITSQILGVPPRCRVISALIAQRKLDSSLAKGFRALGQDAFSTSEARNRIVHDPWYGEIGSHQPAQFRAMPASDPRFGFCDITKADIDQTINSIHELQERASKLQNAVLEMLDTSR